MKVEIDIDMSKIDYNSINKQIREKLENMTPEDIFKKYYYTDEDIREYISNKLDESSKDYMVNQGWFNSNHEAKSRITKMTTDIVKEKLTPIVEEYFKNEEEISKLVNELFPKIFVNVLYDKVVNSIFTQENKIRYDTQALCHSIVENAFRNRMY